MNQDKTSHLSRSTGLDSAADGLPIISDRYRLLGDLGIGGMGKVFLAQDRENGASCALKLMHNHLSGDSTSRLRFEREARLAVGLDHQNIVRVTDFGVTESNEPFMVMEFLVGESLQDLLKKHGRLPLEKFLPIFEQVCAGLQFAHDSGVVHRDMKPSNIMLLADTEGGAKGRVKIVDFGIARVCKTTGEICPSSGKEIDADAVEAGMKLTQPGEVFGSPLYMSPEQCFGEEADCRSEVYSLGCMMFETLTGDAPLRGKNAMDTMLRRVHEKAPSLISACPEGNFPEELDNIVSRCLKRDPDDRFQNVAEVAQALSSL
jgi:eukaryotic-like serine/threonine-protein kinase